MTGASRMTSALLGDENNLIQCISVSLMGGNHDDVGHKEIIRGVQRELWLARDAAREPLTFRQAVQIAEAASPAGYSAAVQERPGDAGARGGILVVLYGPPPRAMA